MDVCTGCREDVPVSKLARHQRNCYAYVKQRSQRTRAGLKALRKRLRAERDARNAVEPHSKRLRGASAAPSNSIDLAPDYDLLDDMQPPPPDEQAPPPPTPPAPHEEQPLPLPVPEEDGQRYHLGRPPQPVPDILPQPMDPLPEREETPTRTPEPEQAISHPRRIISPKNTFEM